MRTRIYRVGIELECELETNASLKKWLLKESFRIESDGSLRHCGDNDRAPWDDEKMLFHKDSEDETKAKMFQLPLTELVSPPLPPDNKVIPEFFKILEKQIANKRYHVNQSCGFHIHVSFTPVEAPSIFSPEFADYFLKRFISHYPKEYELRKNNRFCEAKKMNDEFILDKIQNKRRQENWNPWRYYYINFASFNKYKTIEFRIFPATVDPMKMMEYYTFTIDTVKFFLKKKLKRRFGVSLLAQRETHQSERITAHAPVISEAAVSLRTKPYEILPEGYLFSSIDGDRLLRHGHIPVVSNNTAYNRYKLPPTPDPFSIDEDDSESEREYDDPDE